MCNPQYTTYHLLSQQTRKPRMKAGLQRKQNEAECRSRNLCPSDRKIDVSLLAKRKNDWLSEKWLRGLVKARSFWLCKQERLRRFLSQFRALKCPESQPLWLKRIGEKILIVTRLCIEHSGQKSPMYSMSNCVETGDLIQALRQRESPRARCVVVFSRKSFCFFGTCEKHEVPGRTWMPLLETCEEARVSG